MKEISFIVLFLLMCLIIFNCQATSMDDDYFNLTKPPYDQIEDKEVIDLEPGHKTSYNDYSQKDLLFQKKYDGSWSTANHIRLDSLNIQVKSSSTLKGYNAECLFDKKVETAWVEGKKDDGSGEWINVFLQASKESETSKPFTITEFAMIPGYAKNEKTWIENNRIKTALLIIYSRESAPDSPYRYMVYRLHFEDWMGLQIFSFEDHVPSDMMRKKAWLIIEEVYKGTKYSDTCISEMVFSGGFNS